MLRKGRRARGGVCWCRGDSISSIGTATIDDQGMEYGACLMFMNEMNEKKRYWFIKDLLALGGF